MVGEKTSERCTRRKFQTEGPFCNSSLEPEGKEEKKELELNAWGVGRNEGMKMQPEKATGGFQPESDSEPE